MKNKNTYIIGILCALIVIIGVVWFIQDSKLVKPGDTTHTSEITTTPVITITTPIVTTVPKVTTKLESTSDPSTESSDTIILEIDRIDVEMDVKKANSTKQEKDNAWNKLMTLFNKNGTMELIHNTYSNNSLTYVPCEFHEGKMDLGFKLDGNQVVYVPVNIIDKSNEVAITTKPNEEQPSNSHTTIVDETPKGEKVNKGTFTGISQEVADLLGGSIVAQNEQGTMLMFTAPSSMTFNGKTYTGYNSVEDLTIDLNYTERNTRNPLKTTYNEEHKVTLNQDEIITLYKDKYQEYAQFGTQSISKENGVVTIKFNQTSGNYQDFGGSVKLTNIAIQEIIDTKSSSAISLFSFTIEDNGTEFLYVTYYDANRRMSNIFAYQNNQSISVQVMNNKTRVCSSSNNTNETGYMTASSFLGIEVLDQYVASK